MNYRILIPLFITLTISFGVGYILSDVVGFWKGVIGTTIAQFLLFYIIDTLKPVQKEDQQTLEEEIINAQTAPITCPCGKNTFLAPIFINAENTFQCEHCNSRFRVEVTLDSILVTEPVNLQNAFNHLKEKELS